MKKLLCLLMALAAFCMLATVASAEDATVPTTCAAGCENPTWEPLPSGNTWCTLDAGHYHYYLTDNDTSYRYTPNPASTDAAGKTNSKNPVTICLDLNGYNITTNGRALGVYSGCTLNIMDSSEAQTGYIEGTTGDNATIGGTMFSYGTLTLYSGTIRYVYDGVGKNQAYAGGVISMGSSYPNATFNMRGGRLEGGEMVVNGTKCYGGTFFAAKGNINLYAGDIISGKVQDGYYGPCIYLDGGVKLTLSGDANVDNIYINNAAATVNVSGTYSGKARLTYADSISLSDGKVIGTATNTPNLTGDLFCTNGWLVNVSGSSLKLATYTSSGEWHYCEHCKEVRRWTAMTSSNYTKPKTTSGTYHYYLSESQNLYFQVGNTASTGIYSTACLDLYGNNLTAPTSTGGRTLLPWGGSTLNLMDTKGNGVVTGSAGTNNPNGGTVTVSTDGMFNMYGGTLRFNYSETSTTTKGGTINLNGSMNLYGGTIEGAQMIAPDSGSAAGAAISVNKDNSVLGLYGGTVTSGILPEGGKGACIYVSANSSVVLSGNATVDNIYFAANQKLFTVSDTYSGTASVTFASTVELGTEVGVSDNAAITGRIACTNDKWLVTAQDEKLVISPDADVAIVTDSGEITFDSLQDAVDSNEAGYIKLLHSVTEDVTVSEDLYLDLNGNTVTGTVTVTKGYTLYCKDSQTDDYTTEDAYGYGKLTVSGNATAQEGYLKVTENDAVSFHKFVVEIHTMTLRPQKAGLYYKSTFLGDEQVADAVQSFGVAMSVKEIPNETNMGGAAKYTSFDDFESGAEGNASTSTLLKGILKDENSNEINLRNMAMTVYGRAYLKTADGYIFGETVSRSLIEQLQDIDNGFTGITAAQRYGIMNMYEAYHTVLQQQNLVNMEQQKATNEQTLSILMVGNSFCYYYVEELYGLLMANPDPNRGYSKVEIYNLYESGGRLTQHYEWWLSGAREYDGLYLTNENGRKQLSDIQWNLEDTMMQSDWDYISLQGMSSDVNYTGGAVEDNAAAIVKYAEPLLDYFYELFPDAQLLWHRTWPFEVGRISGTTVYTEELNAAYDAGMQAACDWMCNVFDQNKPYDLQIVNSGKAWPIAREENAKLETSLIPIGGLCARKGVANAKTYQYAKDNPTAKNVGDGYHDGDIGGGQFLNACVWYETITGQSVLENTYQPSTENGDTYTLSDAFVALLRNAAHTALNPTEE